jgi:hypothetical protein
MIMRRTLTTALLVFITATLFQCIPATDRKVAVAEDEIARDINKERREVIKDLRWLRDDINDRLDEISITLETASDESKAGLEEAKLNLIDQRSRVEKSLRDATESADTNWDNIQRDAHNTSRQVKDEFDKLSGRVANALEGD